MRVMASIIGGSSSGSRLSELEQKALEIIKSRGNDGIYQNELWKMLGIDSREGSRIALRLLKKGLIVREPVVHNGRRTYRLLLAKPAKPQVKFKVNLNTVLEIPCFTCPHLERCHVGGFFDPRTCHKLNQWIEFKIKSGKIPQEPSELV